MVVAEGFDPRSIKGVTVETPNAATNHCPACGGPITIDCPDRRSFPVEPKAVVEDVRCPHCGKPLWFTVRRVEAAIVVTFLPGQIINTLSTEQVDDLVSAVAAVSRVVANLAHFRFIPTQLLGTLVRLSRRMAKAGSRFNLCRLSPEAWAALKVTALDRIFEIHDDEASAFASF